MTPFINLASEQLAYLETKEFDSSLPQERLRFNHNIMINTKNRRIRFTDIKNQDKKNCCSIAFSRIVEIWNFNR